MQPWASGGVAHCRKYTDAIVDQFDDAIATVAVGLSGDCSCRRLGRYEATKTTPKKRCGKRRQLAEGRRTFASWRNLLALARLCLSETAREIMATGGMSSNRAFNASIGSLFRCGDVAKYTRCKAPEREGERSYRQILVTAGAGQAAAVVG
jgi:hypothetical protein